MRIYNYITAQLAVGLVLSAFGLNLDKSVQFESLGKFKSDLESGMVLFILFHTENNLTHLNFWNKDV